jgi:type IV fimbrial biogenesis protein FimT
VAITLLAILMMLAVPEFNTWINNTRVRSVAESLQNGMRVAQAEAVRRNRTVAFFLTNDEPSVAAVPAANGGNWGVRTVAVVGLDAVAEFVRGAAINEGNTSVAGTGVVIAATNPAAAPAICFNAAGQQVTLAAEGCTAAETRYDISRPGADRSLRVIVSIGGRVRMCDPNKVLSDTNPDGCPP